MLFSLAKQTGWSLEYMLWELPIVILNQGIHNYLYSKGINVRFVQKFSDEDKKDLLKIFNLNNIE
ncbi:MAG: hypothetical protein EB127_04530 [Alphaproteobacteria bacterium]|nr:hypothetical protein [Alphaproteobacteria bacterium]